MTKKQQILNLYDGKRSTSQIASIVGCLPEYVRVVARQRKGKAQSEIDRRYLQSSLGQTTRRKWEEEKGSEARRRWHRNKWENDPEYRDRVRANKQHWLTTPKGKRYLEQRRAYDRRRSERYRNDAEFRERKKAANRRYWHANKHKQTARAQAP